MNTPSLQPRIIRAKQAPGYLGMCRDVFNRVVRPHVSEFPIGQQGVGFDRIELDKWADAHIAENSIKKFQSLEAAPPLIDTLQSGRKKRSPTMIGKGSRISLHKPPTSQEFYKLVDEILGRSGVKKNRRRNKQSSPITDQ